MRGRILFIIILLYSQPELASARPAELRTNIREACRQEVAGAYLKAYDEKERLRTHILHIKEALRGTTESLKKAREDLVKAQKDAAKSSFSVEKATRRDQDESRFKTLDAQAAEYQRLLAAAEEKLPKAEAREAELKVKISKVFTFERFEDLADGGYPIRLSYTSSCPKYRFLCPLPAAARRDLLAIEAFLQKSGDTSESCRRYAAIKL